MFVSLKAAHGSQLNRSVGEKHLLVSDSVEAGGLDLSGVAVQSHVPQHHDGAEEEGGGVRQVHARDVGGRSMHLGDGTAET